MTGQSSAMGPVKPAVLVVDDDQPLAVSLQRVLRKKYDVEVVGSGEQALRAVMRRSIDVILSDIQMPGMSGVDLLRSVRAHDLDVPVVLMTGQPDVESAIEAIALGALQYLVKPLTNEVVMQAVDRAAKLHDLARAKREALKLLGEAGSGAGDLAGLDQRLNRALETMWIAFQPIVDAAQKRVFGFEALMRAKEPSLPHPGAVLGAAERLDRTRDLGQRVRALAAAAFEHAPPDVLLFVNLHTRDLLDPALYEPSAPLSRMAKRVVLEITERSTIDGVADVQARVAQLRRLGFRIAIDDLGAGYAGLSSFAALEPELVKLDMSLVRNAHASDIRKKLIGSITALCKQLAMQVVAEGIESADERDCVRSAGCDLLQGYFYAKPGPPFPEPSSLG